ncbi:peptidoglycan-binding protein, partial [bacterium]
MYIDRNTVYADRVKFLFFIGIMIILMLAAAGSATGEPVPGPRTMSLGDMGPDVRQLQQDLSALGYNLEPYDGVYGFRTRTAVREFQQKRRIV